MGRLRVMAVVAMAVSLSVSACTAAMPPSPGSPGTSPTLSTSSPRSTAQPSPGQASPTPEPTLPETPVEDLQFEELPRDAFSDPTTIDNEWFPLRPGTRFVYQGAINDDGRVPHGVSFTVTDLTKVIDGIRTVVVYDEDGTDGQVVEKEIAFFAQDDAGNVWLMGEYPEEYEDGEFIDAPTWITGLAGAKAGTLIRAEPQIGPSWPQGWGPEVGWTDRARVFEIGSSTCVPVGCYEDVLVIAEFNPDEPDAHQLKYYAPGVGNVRVGWAGALEEDQEVLELVRIRHLTATAMDELRAAALALEAHGFKVSPDVYAQTTPMESATG
jgi:hypothetical protein